MGQAPLRAWTRRDLTIVSGIGDKTLLIACDSCGGIGLKSGDAFQLSPYYVGKFTARVGLTEVMCAGGAPIAVANGVACEMKPTAEEIIRGIEDELKNARLESVALTGSTEENFPTSMTAAGISVIGVADEGALRFKNAVPGDKLVAFGEPKVGKEVDLSGEGFYKEIRALLSLPEVKEIVPVGSKGIAYEAQTLAALSGRMFVPYETDIGMHKSAGPVTCMIALCEDTALSQIKSIFPQARLIGVMLER